MDADFLFARTKGSRAVRLALPVHSTEADLSYLKVRFAFVRGYCAVRNALRYYLVRFASVRGHCAVRNALRYLFI